MTLKRNARECKSYFLRRVSFEIPFRIHRSLKSLGDALLRQSKQIRSTLRRAFSFSRSVRRIERFRPEAGFDGKERDRSDSRSRIKMSRGRTSCALQQNPTLFLSYGEPDPVSVQRRARACARTCILAPGVRRVTIHVGAVRARARTQTRGRCCLVPARSVVFSLSFFLSSGHDFLPCRRASHGRPRPSLPLLSGNTRARCRYHLLAGAKTSPRFVGLERLAKQRGPAAAMGPIQFPTVAGNRQSRKTESCTKSHLLCASENER